MYLYIKVDFFNLVNKPQLFQIFIYIFFFSQIYKMDIIRNVGVCTLVTLDEKTAKEKAKFYHRNSLPNLEYKPPPEPIIPVRETIPIAHSKSTPAVIVATRDSHIRLINSIDIPDEECAISGRLQIRVVPQPQSVNVKVVCEASGIGNTVGVAEHSPNPEESVYFDAITNGTVKLNRQDSNTRMNNTNNQFDVKVYEDSLKIQKYKIVNNNEKDHDGEEESKSDEQGRNKENMEFDLSRGAISKNSAIKPNDTPIENHYDGIKANDINLLKEITKNCIVDTTDDVLHVTNSIPQQRDCEIQNEHQYIGVEMRHKDMHGNSKIPVLNQNSRISKCASWAGDPTMLQRELSDLAPGLYQKQIKNHAFECKSTSKNNLSFLFPFVLISFHIRNAVV